ncbi:MAG: preprotein translocase subunit YajC [Candidatus Aquirickettsiella sp.]
MSLFITDVLAQSAATSVTSQSNGLSQILILLGFVVIFYLLLWRPQAKRAKEHRQLMANLAIGDEVTTTGGIVGKITQLNDDLISLKVAENVEINLQKAAVSSVLPKGTVKSL